MVEAMLGIFDWVESKDKQVWQFWYKYDKTFVILGISEDANVSVTCRTRPAAPPEAGVIRREWRHTAHREVLYSSAEVWRDVMTV
jgi:hypothetical protein